MGKVRDCFGPAWTRYLERATRKLKAAFTQLKRSAAGLELATEPLLTSFLDRLRGLLQAIAIRAFTEKLHDARRAGTLSGDTPGQRFASFVRSHLADRKGLRHVLMTYPVLARLLSMTTNREVVAWTEMLGRLNKDWTALCTLLDRESSDRLVGVHGGSGDRHDGRQVQLLRFRSGLCLVYKPRPLAVDLHFQALLAWFNARGLAPQLRTLSILDRGDHGWSEHIAHMPCHNRDELAAFYRRLGALLFLAYLLDGVDFHFQNLIACGDNPVLIDLETLFQNRPLGRSQRITEASILEDLASQLVIRTGLLPIRIRGPEGEADISALAGGARERTPHLVARWRNVATDTMRMVMTRVTMPRASNRPNLLGSSPDVALYRQEVNDGFVGAYKLAVNHRKELLSARGPVQAFRHDWVRHLARGSQAYAALLQESYRPSCMRDATERARLFASLSDEISIRPELEALIWSEVADLGNGDVPLFRARVGGTDLHVCRGCRVRGFFKAAALSGVLKRIRNLGDADMERQVECIERSFGLLCTGSTIMTGREPLGKNVDGVK